MNEQSDARREPALQENGLPQHVPGLSLTQHPLQPPQHGFVSFRYSSTEIFVEDGNPRMRRRESHYADGRLVNEEWEGLLEAYAYQRMMVEAQGLFLQQMETVFRLLTGGFFRGGR